ncbi:retinitis pigmentosa 9 protein-like [Pteropus medius]|uniref:retinitis pigmentosa 9 protein-like n=1 Tax=Pteropus vampyrus TaxID=132908 RepID=UPI00196AC4F9|nr:retinitis pigmentosa 9 protein-like [Pteropus giganteus]
MPQLSHELCEIPLCSTAFSGMALPYIILQKYFLFSLFSGWRCKRYGHRTGDKECPFFIKGNQKLEQFRVAHEDPMYDIIRENKRHEKDIRIQQLKQLLEDSTSDDDGSSSGSSECKEKHKKKKKKEKHRKKKKEKKKKRKRKHKSSKSNESSDSD